MDWDREQLERELKDRYRRDFDLHRFVVHTLDSFAHRYFSHAEPVSLLEKGEGEQCYEVKSFEAHPPEALRQKIKESPPESILYALSVRVGERECQIASMVHWGAPDFSPTNKRVVRKNKVLQLELNEWAELRKQLPMGLEDVCSLF